MRETCFSHSLGKGAEEDFPAPYFVEFLEEWVVFVFELVKENYPSVPISILLVLCLTCHDFFMDRLNSKQETHEMIFDGSSTILKLFGTCEGNFDLRRGISVLNDMCKSRNKES